MNAPPKVKVFVEGRYNKLTRDLPQTVFFCPDCKGHPRRRRGCERCEGFGKLTRDSVQELIGWVLGKGFGTRRNKFHGAGREDVDVRMLGEGRPFVMEMIGPKVSEVDLAALEAEINRRNEGRMQVRGLHWTEKVRVRQLKEGKFAKEYLARVRVETAPDAQAMEDLIGKRVTIQQQTPSRVAHRRADKVRERWIEVRSIEATDDADLFEVRLACEHGTYVKEAVSGEGGSTEPSLGAQLGGIACTCEALDVLAILEEDGGEAVFNSERETGTRFGAGL
ncbi:MAG: tRNA pseudouridine synthase 10 [Planctomycetota bacterium]|jgi:tRNA pseudouridine synthase 10